MAITATKLFPIGPEISKDAQGLLQEVWQVTFDGAAGSVAITSQSLRIIRFAIASGSNNITTNFVGKTVTFTWTVNNTPAKLLLATAGTVTVTSIATAAGETTEVDVANASFVEITYVQDQGYQSVTTSSCPSPIAHATLRGTR